MKKQAWQMERELRDAAVPVDRRVVESQWHEGFEFPHGDELLRWMWHSKVPGSLAPEMFFLGMVQDWANQGYDVSKAEALLPRGQELASTDDIEELRVISARVMKALRESPVIAEHPYHVYEYPATWEEVRSAMPASTGYQRISNWKERYAERIYQGWLGQIAGGSFGTALEGYIGSQITGIYGDVEEYITTPETTNDDVVYELLLLDVYEKMGKEITSEALGDEWVRKLPYGVSAEGTALRNLSLGIYPPESGTFLNPFCDWIGAQMRTMVCGMLAPADPMEAARLAYIDSTVSHARNGVYGGLYAAVITSLAFETKDTREIIKEGMRFIPSRSEYAAKLVFCLDVLQNNTDPASAWEKMDKHFERYNWIHAYPNLAADLLALWYGGGDFTASMKLLAKAGYDIDCNGGLVGNVLGIIQDIPEKWAEPIGDLLETYVKGKERLSIRALAEKTASLAKNTQ